MTEFLIQKIVTNTLVINIFSTLYLMSPYKKSEVFFMRLCHRSLHSKLILSLYLACKCRRDKRIQQEEGDVTVWVNNAVFGALDYELMWFRYTTIGFCGKEAEIALTIDGEEDGKFDEEQYAAYKALMQKWEQLQYHLLQPILDYYKQKRHELGYDVAYNEEYPAIETTEQLLEKINLVGITVPYGDIYDERDIGLSFDCTWDEENGVGIRLLDEKVSTVGYQDVAM